MNNVQRLFFELDFEEKRRVIWVEVVDLDSLQISLDRQRDFSEKWCKELVKDFDIRLVHIICARRSDGSLWVIGGQHCWTGAKRKGIKRFIVSIVEPDDREDEEALVYGANRIKNPTAAERADGKIRMGDPNLVAARDFVERFGLVYNRKGHAWNVIRDPKFIADLITEHGQQHASDVFNFVLSGWSGKRQCLNQQNVWAISHLLRRWKTESGQFPTKELLAFVVNLIPDKLGPDSQMTVCVEGVSSRTKTRGLRIATYIANLFNAGRRCNRIFFIG